MNLPSSRKEKQMLKGLYEDCEGPIRGLRLPLNAWNVLHRENITTLPQLIAIADRIERLPGVEVKCPGGTTIEAPRRRLGRCSHQQQSDHCTIRDNRKGN